MTKHFDVIIIGGGIIGSSTAVHLAQEDLKIAVIDPYNLGTPASNAAAGLYQLQLNELNNTFLEEFCIKSFKYFTCFYNTIKSSIFNKNIDFGFNQNGSLHLVFNEEELIKTSNELKRLKDIVKFSFLNKDEVISLEPQTTKEIVGAYYYPEEGFINNPKFLKGISVYCKEKNIRYLNKEVVEISHSKNKIESITLSDNEIYKASKYVLCNGAWANRLLKRVLNLNEDLIKGIKGEILQIKTNGKLLQKVLFSNNGYIVPRPKTNELEQDSLIVGGTHKEVSLAHDKEVFKNSTSAILHLTALLKKLVPGYTDATIIKTWSGIRPNTKDNIPIIGSSHIENLYLGLGHFRNGLLMGPLTGKILSDLILKDSTDIEFDAFSINRFIKELSVKH